MACLEPAYALLFVVFSAGRLRLAVGRGEPRGLLAAEALVASVALAGYLVHRLGYGDLALGGVPLAAVWRGLGPLVVAGYAALLPWWLYRAEVDPSLPRPRRMLIYGLSALVVLLLISPVLWSNVALGLGR